ncbi:unnamed protein product [Didymodactylos carnosus]|uniref:Mammalian ependymin-related protein 1 n=1 Tax=Didymodactylos carnosus TaxID=1234261 RepID=A0A814EJF7_9BILA|nr:unnamed protein product [Didymodactylos carnosus]CAF0970296.1 unnamed protein product [Didymodactylos carnosus]CAF3551943.1 unnamed protein product [Didymodactylos carnosus]CAF3743413.1 unnamed protein product [Didymodactylos carnosus]
MFSIFLVVCVIVGALAQVPRPCVSPPQWEGRLFDYTSDSSERFSRRGRLSYDAVYQRERLIEEIDVGNQTAEYYDVIALFQARIEFVISLRSRNCTRRTINRPFRQFGIAPDARSYGEAYVGTSSGPGAGLLVTIWGGNFTTPQNETIYYIGTWTYEQCIPIQQTYFTPARGVFHDSIYDVTPGISDPDVFIPPRQCLTDEEYKMRHQLFGKAPMPKK